MQNLTSNGLMLWEHDCSLHHEQKLVDGIRPIFHGYDADIIKRKSTELRNQLINNPTIPQQLLQYEIVSEFLQADLQNAGIEVYYGIINAWAISFDLMFFDGFLTQGPEALFTIYLYWSGYPYCHAETGPSLNLPKLRIHIFLIDNENGTRYSKGHLFNAVLHEMCHAYEKSIFNYCQVKNDIEVESNYDSGHGRIWQTLFYNSIEVVSTWHPSLSHLGIYPKPATGQPALPTASLEINFGQLAHRLVRFEYLNEAEWARAFLADKFKAGPRYNDSEGEFMSSLLGLRYFTSETFLDDILPNRLAVSKLFICCNAALFCIIALLLWCFDYWWFDWFIFVLTTHYMSTQSALRTYEAWLTLFRTPLLRLICLVLLARIYRSFGWL
ncbi:hypothetical protein F5B22DRAFT_654389 [Xylaria bambusicola]|uniref:uncharacterized protein n=1 Tax=Xylaria bambusicola TaxID=326684 RepID=UPI0020081676|nr:uncharacterized protein F5B22DRAFT_654389 [Xylaria bambusicola]KAI0518071.1 hypothetical protein F5B22DRAFT_654389 [Xylaria bambusicola]